MLHKEPAVAQSWYARDYALQQSLIHLGKLLDEPSDAAAPALDDCLAGTPGGPNFAFYLNRMLRRSGGARGQISLPNRGSLCGAGPSSLPTSRSTLRARHAYSVA